MGNKKRNKKAKQDLLYWLSVLSAITAIVASIVSIVKP
nr:MAG TPA: hypothetical protein [Caudoviricetes sp.]DAO40192.1 MAG TPA: hypothetical protein [Caudoviricetes sp.]DAS37819.1 MAG TPA: hypothetical protein [Caudoviricetes sp.]